MKNYDITVFESDKSISSSCLIERTKLNHLPLFVCSCVHEYMDVYSEVLQPDPAELVNTPFGGRYCGPIPPRTRVSLYRALALSYHTDKNASTSDIFLGRYQFINDSKYCYR